MLALLAGAGGPAAQARPWPHERSDLEPHPAIRFERLDNGLRLAWMDHPVPPGHVHLRLHVDVGSLAEREDERGLAHVLGHLAYAGSRAHPGEAFAAWFAERGLPAGPHVSGETGYDETVHAIDLTAATPQAVGEALGVLAEIAGALAFEQAALERALADVAREARERDTPAYRAGVEALRTRLAGSRVAERLPLGTPRARAGLTVEAARAFYRRWYRPDLMTVLVVGDLGDVDVPARVRARFGGLAGPGTPTPPPASRGRAELRTTAWIVETGGVEAANLSVESVRPREHRPITVASVLEELPLSYARRLLERRLRARAGEPGDPLLAVSVSGAGGLSVLDGESIGFAAEPARWQEAIRVVEHALRAARTRGFTGDELRAVREAALRRFDEQVAAEPARTARSWVEALLLAAETAYVPTSAAADRERFAPAVARLTPEDCRASLDEAWSRGTFLISCVGDLGLVGDGGERLRAVWERAAREPLGDAASAPVFRYASSAGDAGRVAEREHARDLDVHLVRFENGVRLTVKRTSFEPGRVLVDARVGEGLLSLEPSRAALAWAADFLVNGGGLRGHPPDELARLNAGRQVGLSFTVAQDHFALAGATSADDLLRECELMVARITAPGWHPSAREALHEALERVHAGQERQLVGPISTRFQRALHGGDARFGLPPRADVASATIDEVRSWIEPALEAAPIEVAIVGDVGVEAAVDAVAHTFGALPERREPRAWPGRRAVSMRTGLDERYTVDAEPPAGFVLLAFPTPDGRDARVRRRLNLLARVLARALRTELVERRGLPVDPAAGADASRVFDGLGKLFVQAPCAPDRVDEVREACLRVARGLAERGVDAAALSDAREMMLATIAAERRKDAFWLGVLSDVQSRPGALDELRAMEDDYRAVTAVELSALAREVLDVERVSSAIVTTR